MYQEARPKVSVFILTWNCIDVLSDSFEHIYYEVESLNGQLVIVDNGSTDETERFLNRQIADGRIFKSYRFKENAGISRGKNKGIEMSDGENIIMIDGDIDPVHNSLTKLVEYMDGHKECSALGFYPEQWTRDRNRGGQKNHEEFCNTLWNPKPINRCCIYYGIFRRKMFDDGLRLNEEGEFGKPGYGWEDFDFLERMNAMGITQYVAGMNTENGKYYHKINSSIRAMGRQKYIDTSKARHEEFHRIWKKKLIGILNPSST